VILIGGRVTHEQGRRPLGQSFRQDHTEMWLNFLSVASLIEISLVLGLVSSLGSCELVTDSSDGFAVNFSSVNFVRNRQADHSTGTLVDLFAMSEAILESLI
jgi:hypothetical protein